MIRLIPGRPNGIFWVASYPKSANTWARAMLLNIHQVLAGRTEPASIASLTAFCPMAATGEFYARALGRSIDGMSPSQIAKARPRVQSWYARQKIGLAFLKTHSGRFLENKTPTISPEASAGGVYLVRNPLDVAVSYAHHFSCAVDVAIDQMNTPGFGFRNDEKLAHEVTGSWTENVESWTAASDDGLLVVRYEDAVAEPFKVVGDLARHIGFNPNPLQIALAVKFSSFEGMKAEEASHGFAERPSTAARFFRQGLPGQWREALTAAQVDRVVEANARTMERFGYLP